MIYPAVTVYGHAFQRVQLGSLCSRQGPATPRRQVSPVWAVPLSLATTDGITDLFSFPPVTEMFHFTSSGHSGLFIDPELTGV